MADTIGEGKVPKMLKTFMLRNQFAAWTSIIAFAAGLALIIYKITWTIVDVAPPNELFAGMRTPQAYLLVFGCAMVCCTVIVVMSERRTSSEKVAHRDY